MLLKLLLRLNISVGFSSSSNMKNNNNANRNINFCIKSNRKVKLRYKYFDLEDKCTRFQYKGCREKVEGEKGYLNATFQTSKEGSEKDVRSIQQPQRLQN